VLRWPSLRAPLEVLFLFCCVVLTAFVLVPEIWGSGKTKDYPLWYWAGQQVLHGARLYPIDGRSFEFIYPPLSAVLLAIPAWFGKEYRRTTELVGESTLVKVNVFCGFIKKQPCIGLQYQNAILKVFCTRLVGI